MANNINMTILIILILIVITWLHNAPLFLSPFSTNITIIVLTTITVIKRQSYSTSKEIISSSATLVHVYCSVQTVGLGGLEHNTVMMAWPSGWNSPVDNPSWKQFIGKLFIPKWHMYWCFVSFSSPLTLITFFLCRVGKKPSSSVR